MKRSKLVKLEDCPIGLFIKDDTLCVKTEYGNDAYVVCSGEFFWGGTATQDERNKVMVLPISDKVVQKLEKKWKVRSDA